MKLRHSYMLSALLLGSTMMVAAETNTLEEALSNGELQTTVGWFGQHVNAKGETPNSGFSNGYLNVGFETAPIHGVSVGVAGWGSLKTSEKNDDDYKNAIADQSALSQAYLKVEHKGMGKVVFGRQAVDFNWMTDYIDGVTAEMSAVENLVLSMAWARKYAVIDIDEISEEFSKLNDNKGIYMIDAKYTPIKEVELNPYIYYGDNFFTAYGLKATLNLELSDEVKTSTMAHYVGVNSDLADVKDGSFTQLEQGVELFGLNVAVGYMKTDKDGMVSVEDETRKGLGKFGDQSPFEESNHLFDADAKTPYIKASFEIEGVKLATIYGETKYLNSESGEKIKEKEFNVSVGYEFIKNLESSLMYVNIDNDVKDDSYNAIKAHVAYKF